MLLLIKDKSSDESRKKTDEPVPDVEVEASEEEQEIDTKEEDDDDEVDGKSVDDEEENVSAILFYFSFYIIQIL